MIYITMEEYFNTKVYALDNVIYNRIERKFSNYFHNEAMGKKILEKFMSQTIQELSCNSFVEILDCFIIL